MAYDETCFDEPFLGYLIMLGIFIQFRASGPREHNVKYDSKYLLFRIMES